MGDDDTRSRVMGGPHKGTLLSVRVDAELRAAIRRHREQLQRESPYRVLSDSDAVRDLLLRGLAATSARPAKRR